MNNIENHRQDILKQLSEKFRIYGDFLYAEPCKIGHINETWIVVYNQGGSKIRYILQKINTNVFKNPDAVMENITRITEHIRTRLQSEGTQDITRRVLTIVPTHDGKPYYRTEKDECWRAFLYVEGARTFEAASSPKQAYQAGKAFGTFQLLLSDFKGERLHETIPDFHNTRKRFNTLVSAIKTDHFNRAKTAEKEIEFALKHESIVDVLLKAHASGKIPERITHNDTKFNNVMLDIKTGEQMCVVDLDTVMPGLVLYDFGDMVRTTTSPTLEDELDLSKVKMRMSMFEALVRGYYEATNSFLNKAEKAHLAFSGKLITFTIGIRFLTDFLMGDTYFRVHRPDHNLDRCRTQFKLVESIEEQEEKMQKFVDKL
ncbi:MAG: aminoglycoside phosphotransferase family protein [Verrucomicrobiae bacterium]|nr:aminoglycoside phosphotransferase family protein [Verrucomicrobiae bacterium]